MSYEDISAIDDPLEAIRTLFNEMKDVKSELSSAKSEISRINCNNTKLVVENKNQDWPVRVKELQKEAMHLKNTVPLGDIDKESFRKRIHELLEEDLSKYERKDRGDFQTLQNGLINCEDYILPFTIYTILRSWSMMRCHITTIPAKVQSGC